MTALVWKIGVADVAPVMDVLVKHLRKAASHRLDDAEQAIKSARAEKRVVRKIVRNPVDVPGNADRIDQSQRDQQPPGKPLDCEKQKQHIKEVCRAGQSGDGVPASIGENFRIGLESHVLSLSPVT